MKLSTPKTKAGEVRLKRLWACVHCGLQQIGGKASKKYCSQACLTAAREESKEELAKSRTRNCQLCGDEFIVKKSQIDSGSGKFCSHKCAYAAGAHDILASPDVMKKSSENRKISVAKNGTKHGKGAASPNWKGGSVAARERNRERERAYRNAYRAKNKEKTLEFTRKRRGLMTGRLPHGTIKRIGNSQKWRCVACKCDLKNGYHMDHITPLSKGGIHAPSNIQLLCPKCNVRKSAKHPIDFMQEQGYLL